MDFGSRNRHRNAAVLLLILFLAAAPIVADQKSNSLELTRTARPWNSYLPWAHVPGFLAMKLETSRPGYTR